MLFTWENLRGPRRLLARIIERVILRRVAFVLAGNQAAHARVQRLGVQPARVAVLPQFGVDLARYASGNGAPMRARLARSRGASGLSGGPQRRLMTIGYVGRLVAEKGMDLLIDAAAPLDVQIVIVGDGPERSRMERRVAAWPPGKAVFTGAVAHHAVPDYLAALDALVLPSRSTTSWAEQFGHVLIEARAAGVPVAGSASAAIPEVVADAGLLFPEGDVEALRARLRSLLFDDALRERLIERGRTRVACHYTHEIIAAAQRDVYDRVLAHDL